MGRKKAAQGIEDAADHLARRWHKAGREERWLIERALDSLAQARDYTEGARQWRRGGGSEDAA